MSQVTSHIGKIHCFPSQTLYNQYKESISSNDLALIKEDISLSDASLLWKKAQPTASMTDDYMELSEPFTNFRKLLFIASVESNGYTYVGRGYIDVDVLVQNIEFAKTNGFSYVTYTVVTGGSGIYGHVNEITETKLHYSSNSGSRPQMIYGYK